jgi:hypothetical protein
LHRTTVASRTTTASRSTTGSRSTTARRRAATAVVLSLVGLLLAPTASASAAPAGLRARATVELRSPEQTRPLDTDCWRGWSGALCGTGVVTVDLTGFDAYGGIPSCDPEDPRYSDACEEPVATLVETEGTRVDVAVACAGSLLPRVASFPVTTERTHLTRPAEVGPMTALSSDRAQVQVLFYFPVGQAVALCRGRDARLLTAVARGITVGWESDSGRIPAGTARVPGLHRFR